jgi:hypothetical protein
VTAGIRALDAQQRLSHPDDAEAWVEWITEHALRGASLKELVDGLVASGVPAASAWQAVSAVSRSPILAAARRLVGRSVALEQVTRLHRVVNPEPLTERTSLDEDTLYREHWTAHRPVVFRGAATGWPAARWTFTDLRDRFGFAPVDVSVRRDPGWWSQDPEHRRMPFAAYVDVILGTPSDTLYADGRSGVLEQVGLAPLRAELGLLPGLVGDGHPRAWVGPAGTVTPTHHDQSTGWLVQLVGRKRLFLASPLESDLAGSAVGLFHGVDPRRTATGELAHVRWHEVVLEPGDAVLTPAGWWHHVEALEPSFSVSFSGFRWPNAFSWYLPGGAPRTAANRA